MGEWTTTRDGVTIAGEEAGEGIPVVLLHGLTATRHYVVMGSRALERSGHRVLSYDARGHGASAPARSAGGYDYVNLAADLTEGLDHFDIGHAVIAGVSMGAHTALRFTLDSPERVAALTLITPAFDPRAPRNAEDLAHWDALADGLRDGGVEGFLAAWGDGNGIAERLRESVLIAVRQRLALHEHPEAVADALRAVPRSRPFESLDELAAIDVPAAVVVSQDDSDPGHPRAVGEAYAAAFPRAQLVGEVPGESPLAWQGGRMSRVIAEVAATAAREGAIG